MRAVVYRLKAEARERWLAWLAVAVLVGLVGGVAMALVAGARRTDGVYDRFLAETSPSDVLFTQSPDFGLTVMDLDAVQNAAGVVAASRTRGWYAYIDTEGGDRLFPGVDTFLMSDPGAERGGLDQAHITEGRAANPDAVDEVVVSHRLVEEFDLAVGQRLTYSTVRAESAVDLLIEFLAAVPSRLASPDIETVDFDRFFSGPHGELEIVGIGAGPGEFPPQAGGLVPLVRATPAFQEALGDRAWSTEFARVQLAESESVDEFLARVEQAGDAPPALTSNDAQSVAVQSRFRLQAIGLALLGALFAVAGLVLVAHSAARLVADSRPDAGRLRELGWGPRHLVRLAAARGAIVGALAGLAAVALALALSPLWPMGEAGYAEVEPGIRPDVPVLVAGFAAVFVSVPLLSIWAARHLLVGASEPRGVVRVSRRSPPSLRVGLALARANRGRGGQGLVATSVAFVAPIALLSFVATSYVLYEDLRRDPAAYGWSWDMQVGSPGQPDVTDVLISGLRQDDRVTAAASGTVVSTDIDGERVDMLAVDDVFGAIRPTVLSGVAPTGSGEIGLGRGTLDDLDVDVGDEVEVRVGELAESMRVVGEVVVPDLGSYGGLGSGGFVQASAIAPLVPELVRNVVLLELADADADAAHANIEEAVKPIRVSSAATSDELSFADLDDRSRAVVLGLPALVWIASVASAAAISVRHHSSELAVVRTLGATRRQRRRALRVAALIPVLIAVMVGVPLGALAARLAWRGFIGSLAIEPKDSLGWQALGTVVLIVLVVALVIAAIAGRLGTRAGSNRPPRRD